MAAFGEKKLLVREEQRKILEEVKNYHVNKKRRAKEDSGRANKF